LQKHKNNFLVDTPTIVELRFLFQFFIYTQLNFIFIFNFSIMDHDHVQAECYVQIENTDPLHCMGRIDYSVQLFIPSPHCLLVSQKPSEFLNIETGEWETGIKTKQFQS
jgi:hypothetical protein